jgi:hypothetical protein
MGMPVLLSLWTVPGCGGGTTFASPAVTPITVRLSISPVTVSQDGKPTNVLITITSTSETAQVTVSGLPTAVLQTYQATESSPSGLLTFSASQSTPVGTYMPIISVNSANQNAKLQFVLVVTAVPSPSLSR